MRGVIFGVLLLCLAGIIALAVWGDSSEPGPVRAVEHGGSEPGGVAVESELSNVAAGPDGASANAAGRVAVEARERVPSAAGSFCQVTVQVLQKSGGTSQPVPGAIVHVHPASSTRSPEEPAEGLDPGTFKTASDGTALIEVKAHANLRILVSWPGSSWGQERRWRSPSAGTHDVLKVWLTLGRTERVAIIRSFPSGDPVENATLTVGSANAMTVPLVEGLEKSDSAGRIRLPEPLARDGRPYHFTVTAKDHARRTFGPDSEDLAGAEAVAPALWIRRNAVLRGTVRGLPPPPPGSETPSSDPFRIPILTRVTLKPTRDAGASARPQAQILSPGLLRDSRLRSGQPRSGSGSAEWSADITSDGSWYIGGIEFEDVERLENYRLVSTAPSTSRVIAEGINLGPGDDLTIEDPWVHAPPVDLAFVLDDGRPAANLGRAEILRPDAEPVQETPTWTRSRSLNAVPARALAVTTAEIGADGRLKIDHLPRGSWRWRLTGRGLRKPVEGLFEHNGLDSEPVRLAGYSSLSGTLTEYQEFGSSALHWQSSIRWTLAADPVEPSNRGGSRGVVNVDHGGHFKLPLVPMGKELVIRPLQSFTGSRTGRLGPGSLPQWGELRLTVGAAEQEDVTLLRIR